MAFLFIASGNVGFVSKLTHFIRPVFPLGHAIVVRNYLKALKKESFIIIIR